MKLSSIISDKEAEILEQTMPAQGQDQQSDQPSAAETAKDKADRRREMQQAIRDKQKELSDMKRELSQLR
jgi:hypothetical protein